ncbi:hypothetical protein F5Y17DRAFT_192637 [Xylariaceae sp. FL0594]|nr:hypothetical protein F5Y17DRAFT_192637 [Xylariaceae sp. FL0594]
MRFHQPRVKVIPAACFDICNDALIEAQRVGKTPSLCERGSAFSNYLSACRDCLNTPSGNETGSHLDQWLDYCDSINISELPSEATSAPSITVATTWIPPITQTGVNIIVTMPYTATVDGLQTVWQLTKTYGPYAPLPDVTTITIHTSENGVSTDWILTKSYTHLPSDLFLGGSDGSSTPSSVANGTASTQPTQTTTSTQSPTPPQSPTSSQISTSSPSTPNVSDPARVTSHEENLAWLAGPIIGGVAGLMIIALLPSWFLFRRRRKRARGPEAELHGESAHKAELEVKDEPQELEAERDPQEFEAPVLERQASELPAGDVGRRDGDDESGG